MNDKNENQMVVAASSGVALKSTPMTAELSQTIDISVSGETREEIARGQRSLMDWCERKIAAEKSEYEELRIAVESARAKKWKTSTLEGQAVRCKKRVEYYEKMLAAFREGYILVPNFPLTIFAIRTGKTYPKQVTSFSHWERFEQKAQSLEHGKGVYQNPDPIVFEETVSVAKKEGGTEVKKQYSPDEWDAIDFPVMMAKPHIMEAVDHAMALKIFDEVGILPQHRVKGDPMIGGVLIMGGVPKWAAKRSTFMLAWHVDTRTL